MSDHCVLIVDDDADIRETITEVLEDAGFTVAAAENGKAALSLFEQGERFCIVLLDLMMPVMDGRAFHAAMQSDPAWASTPIVVLTAGAGGKEASAQLGAVDFLAKPFHLDALLRTVRQYC